MRRLLLPVLVCFSAPGAVAQTLTIKAIPVSAEIYRVGPRDSTLISLGVGIAKFKLENKDPNTVVVRLEGYRDVSQSFVKGANYKDKNIPIVLSTRLVSVTVLPADATILVDGESRGSGQAQVEVVSGDSVTVEVRKTGYVPVRRVYRHGRDGTLPPVTDRVELTDRVIALSATPAGAELFKDGNKIGEHTADLTVPAGTCVIAKAQKTGWSTSERSYCNKDGLPPPPIEDRLELSGRVVKLLAPTEARIFIDQKLAGTGSAAVSVPEGGCVQVRVEQPGFLQELREYCARERSPALPPEDAVQLKPDDSFAASTESDQANANVAIEVGPGRPEDQAWRVLSSIVLSQFDVLENADRDTGYLRTAWQLKTFADGAVVIRTRVIVKRTGNDPLRYTVKLASERLRAPGLSVRDDDNFAPWERLLNAYKDLIPELQVRLPQPVAPRLSP